MTDCEIERAYKKKFCNNTWNNNDTIGLLIFICPILIFVLYYRKNTKFIPSLLLMYFLFVSLKPIWILYFFSMIFTLFLKNPEFLDKEKEFPKYVLFENNFENIKQEVVNLLDNTNNGKDIVFTKYTFGNQNAYIGSDIKDNKGWRIYNVKLANQYPKNVRNEFPVLVSVLDQCPEIIGCIISILEGQTMIPIHNGYYKGILRFMLPIIIPKDKDNVYLCNNYIKYVWEEGKSVLWDDLYPHKVFNKTDDMRVVIYMDVKRKNIPTFLKVINNIVSVLMGKSKIVRDEIKRTEKKVKI